MGDVYLFTLVKTEKNIWGLQARKFMMFKEIYSIPYREVLAVARSTNKLVVPPN
jgi:hypothetical protein